MVVDGVQVKYKKGVLSYQPTVTTQHEEESTEEKPVKSNELVIPRGGEKYCNPCRWNDSTFECRVLIRYVLPVNVELCVWRVKLYFDVAGDENHPFVVQTHLGGNNCTWY